MKEVDTRPVPHLRSIKDWISHIFYGLCIGAADVVPGLSGGTMALILGIYENLIHSIKSFSSSSAMAIFKLRLPTFFRGVSLDYLLAVVAGMLISIGYLSQIVHELLEHEVHRVYFYSLFFGMVIASVIVCAKLVRDWELWNIIPFMVGCLISFNLTAALSEPGAGIAVLDIFLLSWINPWLVLCGAAAVSAMLLPGISGSYILMLLGAYPRVIKAVADFTNGINSGIFKFDSFLILANLGIGIICGAIVFSRVISWLLKNYHTATIALLIGFMLGAMRAVWPFWTYDPSLSDPFFWQAFGVIVTGFSFVLMIEAIVSRRIKRERRREVC